MLSYQKWKILNESLNGPLTLGISTPSTLGIMGRRLEEAKKKGFPRHKDEEEDEIEDNDEEEEDEEEDEKPFFSKKKSKKKSKKFMKGDVKIITSDDEDDDDDDVDVEDDDDDVGSGDSPCGFCNKNAKKKAKKKSKKFMGSEMGDMGSEMGDDMGSEMGKPPMKKSLKKPLHKGADWEDEGSDDDEFDDEEGGDEDMGGDKEGGEDLGDEDMGGDEEGGEDLGDEEGGMGHSAMKGGMGHSAMKGGMGHSAMKGGPLNKKKHLPPPDMGSEPMFMKKMKKTMKKESFAPRTEEERAWWASLKSMLGSDPNHKYGDGWTEYQEEALYPPTDPNSNVREPGPGEIGFAPQSRVASSWEGTPIDGFSEGRKRR